MEDSLAESNESSTNTPQKFEKRDALLSEDLANKVQKSASAKISSAESVKRGIKPNGSVPIKDKNASSTTIGSVNNPVGRRSTMMKSAASTVSRSSGVVPVIRRNSTGGVPEKKPMLPVKRAETAATSGASKLTSSTKTLESVRRSLPEIRRSSLPSVGYKSTTRTGIAETRSGVPVSPVSKTPRSSVSSEASKTGSTRRVLAKPSPSSVSSISRVSSTSLDSTSSSSMIRRSVTKVSSPTARSPSISSGLKSGSLSASMDRRSNLSGSQKSVTPKSRDSRLIMLPQVEIKAGDDVRLDLRGHRIRSLNSSGLNLSPNLEFVYLRDNFLSALDGIEILKHVKVLDLSFNDFKGPGFEPLENCKALQQLYLAGNQITSLVSLPELPNLEFLSVAQNNLRSLGMASQPRLQVLAASKNKISTLKGFPHLPVLEHLRVEENPILKMPNLEAASILLIGPTLKKFNDKDLSREAIAVAKRYPAHTAVCIRNGWEFCGPDQAVNSTFRFLLEKWKEVFPPGYLVKEASVDKPYEEDACYCHFDFVKDGTQINQTELIVRYQWFLGERTPSNFLAIPGATTEVYWPKRPDVGRMLKVECTPILGETEHPPIFAISSPVAVGTGIPKVLKINVRGDLVEGNVIMGHVEIAWCGGTPGKGVSSWLRRRWNSSPVVISGEENDEYSLTLDDIDSCLVYMYTPVTEEGAKGEPQYAITDHIKAAPPSVSDVQILGDSVEGNTIRGIGKYFGGREGPSKFQWLREDDIGEFILVSVGANEYNIQKEDIGRRLAFSYTPVNFEGQEGKPFVIVSQVVKKAPPKVTNVKIVGELKEGSKVTVSGIVTGGTEASSRVQWFKTRSKLVNGEDALEALSTSKIAKAFRIPLGAVAYYIVAKFTPMTPEGEAGEVAYAISEKTIETLPPSINFLSITGDYCEGGILTASYGYIGGHEGKSIYNWYHHETDNDAGSLVPELSGVLQYRITKDAIGKIISFACTPVRDDGIVGELKTCIGHEPVRPGSPRLLSLKLIGSTIEGMVLNVEKKYWGGEEGESIYRWFRTSSDGNCTEISDATVPSYRISVEDIGFFISISCEPVRIDGVHGPVVVSELVGPIIPGFPTCLSLEFRGSFIEGERLGFIASYSGGEKGDCSVEWFLVKGSGGGREQLNCEEFLDLTLEHVGERVEVVYTPVRKDGIRGNPMILVSNPVAPGNPVAVELVISECSEGELVVPHMKYFGGHEGVGEYIWYRTKTKLQISDLMDLFVSSNDVHLCCKTLSYVPSIQDVGFYLAFYWVPTRSDGKHGQPLAAICDYPVIPAFPVALNVRVKEVSSSIYLGEGEYFGGYEGSSLFSWYRKTLDGTVKLIDGANTKTYEVQDEDYTCRLLFGYTPVRSDSVIGEHKLSDSTDVILPELPRIEMLTLTGKATEGDVITAVEVIPKSESQQKVWSNYRRDVKYQWFCSSEVGNMNSFEQLPSQSTRSYKVRFEDIGCCLKCECVMTDVFGRSSAPVYAETVPVLPGVPRIDKLEIEGRGFHTNLYAVRGTYSGGREGKSKIQWLRSMVGSPDLITIPGETGRMYEANVDDVGYRLVAIYTPIRDDGIEGQPLSVSTEPIAVEPDVIKEVKTKIELGSIKFEVLCSKNPHSQKVPGLGALERRVLEVNRKRVKVIKPGSKTSFPATEIRGTYSPPFHVEIFRNDVHRLRIVVDGDNDVDLMVQTRHSRDVIVLVIRGFAQRFNSTSLNSLLKIDA